MVPGMNAETDLVLVDKVAVALFEFEWRGSIDHRGAAWISHREKYMKRARVALAALDAQGEVAGIRFRVETACDGYSALLDTDVPPDITFHDDYLQGAHDAAEAIRAALRGKP